VLRKKCLMEEAKKLWEELGDVPIDENEDIDIDWHIFEKGTSKFDIWTWFEEEFNISIIDLMNI